MTDILADNNMGMTRTSKMWSAWQPAGQQAVTGPRWSHSTVLPYTTDTPHLVLTAQPHGPYTLWLW